MGVKDEQRMGRKSPRSGSQQRRSRPEGDSEFINIELNNNQTADYRAWRGDTDTVFTVLDEAVNSGYKVSLKYDDYSSSFAVFMFPPPGNDNTGYILTGRGGTAYRALGECLYKHHVIFAGTWLDASISGSPSDDPDW